MGKINIAIDASRFNFNKPTGVEDYCDQIISRIIKNKNYHFTLISPNLKPDNIAGNNVTWVRIKGDRFWTQYYFRKYLNENSKKFDCVFIPSHVLPLFARKRLKFITTIHDVAFIQYPKFYSRFQNLYLRYSLKIAGRSRAVIVPSFSTKKDLIKYTKLNPEKIYVIYHGINNVSDITTTNLIKIKKPYILYTGRIEAKKNITTLIKAYTLLKKEKGFNHQLILAGKQGNGSKEIFDEINNLTSDVSDDIIYTGYVNNDDYSYLIRNADVYVLPSIYEGFGLTIIEAMSVKVPVVASDIPCLKEIAGDGAILVNPLKPFDFASQISKIIHKPEIRKKLIQNSLENIKKFDWDKCAKQTLDILIKVSTHD